MSIRFLKNEKRFVINTKNTTYAFEIAFDRYLCHTYYGKRTAKLPEVLFRQLSFAPYLAELDECKSPDLFVLVLRLGRLQTQRAQTEC